MPQTTLRQACIALLRSAGGHVTDHWQELDDVVKALAEPELAGRQLQRMKQQAWKRVQEDYMDDPEVCFALGFDAGYDAVARRVEPPEMESGGGFESCPASLEQTDDAEWARHLREPIPSKQPEQEKSRGQV